MLKSCLFVSCPAHRGIIRSSRFRVFLSVAVVVVVVDVVVSVVVVVVVPDARVEG